MPLFIEISGKKHHINLNNYRNMHYHLNNKIKKEYAAIVRYKLRKYKDVKLGQIEIKFIMHRKDKRKVDRANVLSIHEKFFCDAMVDMGLIEDDNDNFILKTTYQSGEVSKITPGIHITIRGLQ